MTWFQISRNQDSIFVRALLSLYCLLSTCHAGALPAVISKSSDGKYEIRPIPVKDADDPADRYGIDSFRIALFDTKTGAKISDLTGEYDVPHGSEWISLWHPTLPVVAIHVNETRRFGHIEVFSVVGGKCHKLSVPDYEMNALGRVNATKHGNTCFSQLSKWNKNDLQVMLDFNAYKEGTRQFQDFYSCEVTLRLDDSAAFFELISISPPKEP